MAGALAILTGMAAVLCSAWLFTNALEWFGVRAGVSHSTLGSVFAAVGTALPETSIAVLATAVGGGTGRAAGDAVGIGAILGAPLLLATLGLALLGVGALRRGGVFLAVPATIRRDLGFFLGAFGAAAAAGVVAPRGTALWRWPLAGGLLAAYVVFLAATLRRRPAVPPDRGAGGDGDASERVPQPRQGSRGGTGAVGPFGDRRSQGAAGGPTTPSPAGAPPDPLLLTRRLGGAPPGWGAIALQLGVAVGLMLVGAELFVITLTTLSLRFGLSGYTLAALIGPLATELPETANSLVWARQGKDALAAGNVTGALVLQGSVVPAVGILFTPWHFTQAEAIGACCGLVGPAAVFIAHRSTRRVPAWLLTACGVLYGAYVAYLL